uniref:Replication-associated protein n=1 Tax=Phoenicopterus roseus CRESS-DNA-virus sp. TaxID=2815052 RepID=A0A8A4XCI8_9VIRU|nr:MAG: putative replication-associated protein [Phoenicopterus roseus CRESS-DNA-virus sp.]
MSGLDVLGLEVAEGNTSLQPQNKKYYEWCFTINNPTEEEMETLEKIDCRYICYAPEIGDSGTRHIQGYIVFKSKRWLSALKKIFKRAHFEAARGTGAENKRYIQGPYDKGDKHKPLNPDFVERGDIPAQGKRNDIVAFREAIVAGKRGRTLDIEHPAIVAKYPKLEQRFATNEDKYKAKQQYANGIAPEVHVRWGPPGTGKTRAVYEAHSDSIYEPTIRKCGTHWWTGYEGEDVILLDEFNGQIPIRDFLRLIDRYPFSMETKGGHTWRVATKIYICSNTPPQEWYPAEAHQYEKIARRLTSIIEVV